MNQYVESAKLIYETINEKVIGYGIKRDTGETSVRLHVVDCHGNLSKPIELNRSQIDNIKKLMDYLPIDRRDLREIKQTLKTDWFSLPCINECKNLGFQRDNNNDISGYMGAICYDSKGNEIIKDIFSSLPNHKGTVKEIVDYINPYMKGRIKRQIILAHSLAGAICGIINRNIILSLVGESSLGKTTIQKLGVSFFTQTDYNSTVLKWSATENALVKRLDNIRGVNVLIDDTQLSKLKNFSDIIYSFENGQSKDRLIKSDQLNEKCHWAISIGITAENTLLDTFKDLGAVARIIEMPIYKNDLFDNEKQVAETKQLYQNSYGIIGTTLIQELLKTNTENDILKIVSEKGKTLCQNYTDRITNNNILKRHLEGDIAIIATSAEFANTFLGFSFDINGLECALLDLCEENYRTFDENKFENVIAHTIYTDMLVTARTKFPNYERDNKIIIPSKIMKGLLTKYVEELHVKSAKIKDELARQGLLSEKNGAYCWNHTIDGKNVTGYELILK